MWEKCQSVKAQGEGSGTGHSFGRSIALAGALSVFLLAGAVLALPPRTAAPSLDEINSRIAAQQRDVDSLTALRERLRLDSARTSSESSQRNAAATRRQSESNDAIAMKKAMAAKLRQQYVKAQQDSAGIVAKWREQNAALHKELALLEASIMTRSADLQALSARRDQIGGTSAGDDRAGAGKLHQQQIARRDSLIRVRQNDAAEISAKRDKLRLDSLQAETKRTAERAQFSAALTRTDSMIAAADAAITQADQKSKASKADKDQKIAQAQGAVTTMTNQKKAADQKISLLETEIGSLGAERQRTIQSSDESQRRYEQAHAPYQKALTAAETDVQKINKEKNALNALRQKLVLDSAVAKTRDALDKAIQAEAEKKKGAKKLVEQRENELDSLLSRQDAAAKAVPGLRQFETRYQGSTVNQKMTLVDSVLGGIDTRVATAVAARDKAAQNLALFEKKNPKPQDPSTQRVQQIDDQVAAKKKEVIQLTAATDSLNIQIQEAQNNLSSLVAAQPRAGTVPAETGQQRAEKAALTEKRSKLIRDSIQNDAANTGALLRIKSEMTGATAKILLVQNEIAQHTAERDKSKQALAAIQERSKQQQTSAAAERKKTDSLIAVKQQEISMVSLKSEKTREDSISLYRQVAQQLQSLNPAPGSLASPIATLDREIALLQNQNDSLRRSSATGVPGADESAKIAAHIASVNRSLDLATTQIATLQSARTNAIAKLTHEKDYYDSLAAAGEKELAALTAKLEKARKDSLAGEALVRQASQKASAGVTEQDNALAAKQQESAQLSAELNRAIEDSARSAEKIPATVISFHQAIQSIDATIAIKQKELADLQQRREKAKQDSAQEYKRQSESLIAAHNEIVKRGSLLAQKRADIATETAKRKKMAADTVLYQKQGKDAVVVATMELQRIAGLIEKKKSELARLQSTITAANANVRATSSRGGVIETPPTTAPAAATPVSGSPVSSGAEVAQKRSEEIYTLLGENKVAEAAKKFKTLQGFLKINLDAEAFQTLKTTIEQMGGSVK
jgi:hypothetical protein